MQRQHKLQKAIEQKQTTLTIVFENISDPHNVSAVLRTAESVGLYEVYVIDNLQGKQKFNPGWRSSAGAFKWLKINYYQQCTDCMQAVRKRYEKILATHLQHSAQSLYKIDFTQSVAVVVGNEIDGVSNELLQHCDGNIFIPQIGLIQSLNVSVASSVILYEALRQRISANMIGNNIDDITKQVLLQQWK